MVTRFEEAVVLAEAGLRGGMRPSDRPRRPSGLPGQARTKSRRPFATARWSTSRSSSSGSGS